MSAEMRRRLIDHARRRHAEKRGGGSIHQPVDTSIAVSAAEPGGDEAMLRRLDQAIAKLNDAFPRAARIVELRYMAELTTEETAAHLGLSVGTVKRDWRFARAWLASAIESV
jgi:RNA polymerase sigma factor (TIGR02999 family)